MTTLLVLSLAICGLAASWFKCVDHTKKGLASVRLPGKLVVVAVVLLTISHQWFSSADQKAANDEIASLKASANQRDQLDSFRFEVLKKVKKLAPDVVYDARDLLEPEAMRESIQELIESGDLGDVELLPSLDEIRRLYKSSEKHQWFIGNAEPSELVNMNNKRLSLIIQIGAYAERYERDQMVVRAYRSLLRRVAEVEERLYRLRLRESAFLELSDVGIQQNASIAQRLLKLQKSGLIDSSMLNSLQDSNKQNRINIEDLRLKMLAAQQEVKTVAAELESHTQELNEIDEWTRQRSRRLDVSIDTIVATLAASIECEYESRLEELRTEFSNYDLNIRFEE